MNSLVDGSRTHSSDTWRWPFFAAIAVLLLCSGLAVQQYTRFADADAEVAHTHEVLDSIDRVLTRLVDAETGQRAYLLTTEPGVSPVV